MPGAVGAYREGEFSAGFFSGTKPSPTKSFWSRGQSSRWYPDLAGMARGHTGNAKGSAFGTLSEPPASGRGRGRRSTTARPPKSVTDHLRLVPSELGHHQITRHRLSAQPQRGAIFFTCDFPFASSVRKIMSSHQQDSITTSLTAITLPVGRFSNSLDF